MIKTRKTQFDIGGQLIKINIVDNADELYMDALYQDEAPVWLNIWPSAIALARWLSKNVALEGTSVLELGAGLGLAGLVIASKGGNVCQTDYIQEALDIAKQSSQLNNLDNIRQVKADWRDFPIREKFDFIIGSDFLYSPDMHPYLRKIFTQNLKTGGKIYISDPGRLDSKLLLKELAAEGWQITEETYLVHKEGFDYNIYVFELTK